MGEPEPASEDSQSPATDPQVARPDPVAAKSSYRLGSDDSRQLTSVLMTASVLVLLGAAGYVLNTVRSSDSVAGAIVGIAFLAVLLLGLDVIVMTTVHLTSGRVEVDDTELVSFNSDGVYAAQRTEITTIELRSRAYGRSIQRIWVPLVRTRDGAAFWLDPLGGGREDQPPKPEQEAAVEQIRGRLGLTGDLLRSSADPFPHGQSHFARPMPLREGTRTARLVPIALAAKTIVFAALIVSLVPTGKGHHTLVAALGAVAYLAVGLLVVRRVTHRRAGHPASKSER